MCHCRHSHPTSTSGSQPVAPTAALATSEQPPADHPADSKLLPECRPQQSLQLYAARQILADFSNLARAVLSTRNSQTVAEDPKAENTMAP